MGSSYPHRFWDASDVNMDRHARRKTRVNVKKSFYFFLAASSSSFWITYDLATSSRVWYFTCLGGPSLASTFVSLVSAGDTERPVGLEFMLCVCDGARCFCRVCIRERNAGTRSSSLQVLRLIKLLVKRAFSRQAQRTHWWVTLLHLSGLAGEDNKARLVCL